MPLPDARLKTRIQNRIRAQAARAGYQIMDTAGLDAILRDVARALVVGTMSPEAFAKDHIPGSVNFSLENSLLSRLLKKRAFRRFLGPDKDRPLVFYSLDPAYADCHSAALLAVRLGYQKVYRYPDGIVGWMRSGRAAAGTMHDEIQP